MSHKKKTQKSASKISIAIYKNKSNYMQQLPYRHRVSTLPSSK